MKNPMVVGYKGEIGSFILNGLLRIMPKALDIWCVDVNETDKEVVKRIKASDVIFLCVPMDKTIEWMVKYKNQLKGKVIIEQCSLKEWIYDNEDVKGLDIRSMHILFRPSQTPNLEDRKVAFFKGQLDVTLEWKISEITQAKVVLYSDAEQHDKDMAVLQAVMHRILLVAGNELSGCLGSTFISQKVVELEKRIKKGDKELYKKIQQNKHLPKQMEEIKKRLDRFDIEDYMK